MRKILVLIGVLVLVLPCVSLAQGNSNWSNLTQLHAGQKIQIIETNAKKHSGIFVSASDTAISYRETAGEHSLEKQDIRSVKVENNHHLRNTLILTGVGAGVGAGIGAAATGHGGGPILLSVSHAKGAGVGAVLGAVGGVTVGALLPSHHTIYSVGPN
jgi:hypothetical protein